MIATEYLQLAHAARYRYVVGKGGAHGSKHQHVAPVVFVQLPDALNHSLVPFVISM